MYLLPLNSCPSFSTKFPRFLLVFLCIGSAHGCTTLLWSIAQPHIFVNWLFSGMSLFYAMNIRLSLHPCSFRARFHCDIFPFIVALQNRAAWYICVSFCLFYCVFFFKFFIFALFLSVFVIFGVVVRYFCLFVNCCQAKYLIIYAACL